MGMLPGSTTLALAFLKPNENQGRKDFGNSVMWCIWMIALWWSTLLGHRGLNDSSWVHWSFFISKHLSHPTPEKVQQNTSACIHFHFFCTPLKKLVRWWKGQVRDLSSERCDPGGVLVELAARATPLPPGSCSDAASNVHCRVLKTRAHSGL